MSKEKSNKNQNNQNKKNKKHRFLAFFLSSLVSLGMGYGSLYIWKSCSVPFESSIFKYVTDKDGNVTLYGFKDGISKETIIKKLGDTLVLPKNVTVIADNAFYVDGVSTIPNEINNVILPNTLISIGANAFRKAPFVVSPYEALLFNNNIKTIGEYAFEGCQDLGGIHLNNKDVVIGNGAFSNCTSLQFIDFSLWDNVPTIEQLGTDTFKGISETGLIVVPDWTLADDYKTFFNENYGLVFDSDHWSVWPDEKNVLHIEGNTLMGFEDWALQDPRTILEQFPDGIIHIPSHVTQINDFAFYVNNKATIPEGIKGIVFDNPNNLKKIGNGAFFKNTVLESINLNDCFESIEYIGDNAFNGCTKLNSFGGEYDDPTTLFTSFKTKYIGNYAFYNCSSIESLCLLPFEDSRDIYVGINAFAFNSNSFKALDLSLLMISNIDNVDQTDISKWKYAGKDSNNSFNAWISACNGESIFHITKDSTGTIYLPFASNELLIKVTNKLKAFAFTDVLSESLTKAHNSGYYWVAKSLNSDELASFINNWELKWE